MSYISNNSIVSREEAAALKDMIFNRVKERAAAISEEVNSSYTSDVQTDLMDIARSSFESKKNPFAQIVGTQEQVKTEDAPKDLGVGFSQRKTNAVESQIVAKSKEANDAMTKSVVEETMTIGGNELARKQSFLGALDFLNSQATISLVNKRAKRFEAFA